MFLNFNDKTFPFCLPISMCVHNCRGFRSSARYKFTCYFCGWLRRVAVWAAERCKKCFHVWFLLFSMRGEAREIIENQYLSQSPLEIFSSFFFKLRYSINLSYFLLRLSLFLGSRRKGEKEQTRKKLPFLFFAFHFDYDSMAMEFHFS